MTKMIKLTALASLALLSGTLAGCDGGAGGYGGGFSNENIGTGVGAVAGGLIGSRFGKGGGRVATGLAGALIGGIAGNVIGRRLTPQDQPYYQQAAVQANTAPVGQTINWVNPETGTQGTITPTRYGNDANGNYCREYQQTITVGGQTQKAFGTACRQPDGSWKVVS